jgi:nucleoside-diphosphate-sugar epimerase
MTAPLSHTSAAEPATRLIVGCGYLGTRVAARWLAAGDRVVAVTRRPERAEEFVRLGMTPLVADVTDPDFPAAGSLPDAATVFWAVGFDRSSGTTHRDVHVLGLARLLAALPGSPRVILSSSTGVWGDEDGRVVTEDTPAHPTREAGRVLLEAESLLRTHPKGPGVALRFAGLYGPDRLPRIADLRAGTPIAADPESWLNLIHVDDAAEVVRVVAAASSPRPLYVVSDGRPVRRRDWYGTLAAFSGSPPPTWDPTAPRVRGADKRVDPALLFRDLPISLTYPDALAALETLVG